MGVEFRLSPGENTSYDTIFADANAAATSSETLVIHLAAGDFPCTSLPTFAAGVRLVGEGRIVTATTHIRTWEYGGEASTVSDRTYYVDATDGNDANDGLAAGAGRAFKTLQRAWNQLPPLIMHRITIQIADGDYDSQELLPGDMPRPAILWLTGKVVRGRTDQTGGGSGTSGYVLFQGTSKAGTVIRTATGFTYGIYASQVNNIGFAEFTVRSNTAGTVALLVAHRTGTYLQGSNIDIDGNASQASLGIYVESGGVLELTGDGQISGSSAADVQVFDESLLALADTITVGTISVAGRGTLLLANRVSVSGAAFVQNGQLKIEGTNPSSTVTVAALTLINAELNATYAMLTGAVDAYNSSLFLNACGYSNSMVLQNSDLHLRYTPSYISPATASTVADPIILLTGSRFMRDSATNSPINGSGGRTNAVRHVISLSVSSNGATVPVYLAAADNVHHTIDGNGGNRTSCILAAVDTSYGGAPIENTVMSIINTTTNSVQLIDSTTSDFVSGAITLGQNSGNYQGVTLRWTNGRWREVSRSLAIP